MPARTRSRAPRLAPSDRRAQLIQAAVRIFLRRGYQASKVRDVVREARVARGTFYLHFESKRQLLAAVARELVDRLPSRLIAPPAPRTRAGLEAALTDLHLGAFRAFHASRETARLLFGESAATEPLVARALAVHDKAWRRLVASLLSRAREAKLLREGIDPDLAADAVLGAVQRVVRVEVLGAERPDLEGLAAGLARLQAASLAPDPA